MDKVEDSKDFDNLASRWQDAIKLAGKRQASWEARGDKIVERYRDDRTGGNEGAKRFNILWSNVETLKPSLYSQQPKPQVMRRYKDKDPVGRDASEVLERALEFSLDSYDFDGVMVASVLDYLLPGRSVARVKYKPTYSGEGEDQEVVYEEALSEYVFWKDFRHGPARSWVEVTWVAFRSYMSRAEMQKRFGDIAKEVDLNYRPDDADEDDEQLKKAVVWELWDKESKQVFWVAESLADKVLDQGPPPLQLNGFFPCPKPLYSLLTNDKLIPVPDYVEYQDQADELDDLSGRIGVLISALKVVGVYAGDAPEVARMLSETTDNQLIPVDNWAMFADKGGTKGMIDWFPVDQVGNVLIGLYEAREKIKQELYEITGLSDILRGASKPNETATAQRIKGQFASLRIGDRQKQVAIYARDILRLKAEVICEQLSPQTLQVMTGLDHTPEEWEEITELLRNDPLRTYRIDIETESTIQIDEEGEKANRLEFVTTVGEFMQGAVPFVQESPELRPIVSEMLMFAVRGFKVGRRLESTFEEALADMSGQEENPALSQANQMIEQLQGQLQELMQGREGEMYEIEKQTKVVDIEVKRMEQQAKQVELQAKQAEAQARAASDQVKQAGEQQQLAITQETAAADIRLKQAQTMKTAEEARAQDLENDAVESGIHELVEGGGIEELQSRADQAEQKVVQMTEVKEGPKDIKITRTENGLEGVITDSEGNERHVVVNNTDDGMVGMVEGE